MKPFDLEAAKRGEPICTRSGRPIKFITYVPEAHQNSQLVVLDGATLYVYYADGRYCAESTNTKDLFMAAQKRTVWVNLYRGSGAVSEEPPHLTRTHLTQESADHAAGSNRIGGKAWPLEFEE